MHESENKVITGRLVFPSEEERESTEELKLAINNLIWIYSPDNTILKEAEEIALITLLMIQKGDSKVAKYWGSEDE